MLVTCQILIRSIRKISVKAGESRLFGTAWSSLIALPHLTHVVQALLHLH
jgi:hypothetical protein